MRGIQVAVNFSIHFETKEVNRMINTLLNRVERPRVLLKNVQRWIKYLTMKMFRGRRPDTGGVRGVRWPKLKKSTIAFKKSQGARQPNRPMVYTGKLRDSLKVLQENEKGFVFGTRIKSERGFPYGGFHNKNRFPFLFLRREDFLQIQQMTIDYLNGEMTKAKKYLDINNLE